MNYVAWAIFAEGPSDVAYLEVLIPRLMETLIMSEGIRYSDILGTPAVKLGRSGRAVDDIAREACEAKSAFHILFVHADTGGRALQKGVAARSTAYCRRMSEICDWPPARCVILTPRHEIEAWILADPQAVMGALGYRGKPSDVGLPSGAVEAERLLDAKAALANAVKQVRGAHPRNPHVDQLFPAIAQRQLVDALRRSHSFREFEARLRVALSDLGCIGRLGGA